MIAIGNLMEILNWLIFFVHCGRPKFSYIRQEGEEMLRGEKEKKDVTNVDTHTDRQTHRLKKV